MRYQHDDRAAAQRAALDAVVAARAVFRRAVELAPVTPVTGTWMTPVRRDPLEVSLEEKVGLLLPGERDITADDIIADTARGILIRNRSCWSIDHQRYNFQFSGQGFYEIRNGKIVGMLRDVAYQVSTPVFWNSMDRIGGRSSYWLGGAFNDGKGEPSQINLVSHRYVPARFRNVTILNMWRTA